MGQTTPTHHEDSEIMCSLWLVYRGSRSCHYDYCVWYVWLPCLAGWGQHSPPAVAQQYPHVPHVLQCGGQSPLTECIVMCVLCVLCWVWVWVCMHMCIDMHRGGSESTNKLVLTSPSVCPPPDTHEHLLECQRINDFAGICTNSCISINCMHSSKSFRRNVFSFHKCSKILSLVFHENFVLQKICIMKFPASILYTVVLHKISKPSI